MIRDVVSAFDTSLASVMPRLLSIPALVLCFLALAGADGCRSERIGAVQGTGAQSPLVGQVIAIDGIVVGGSVEGLGGVFVQETPGDDDPTTSDGVFVVPAEGVEGPPRLARVKVVGKVSELGDGAATLTALTEAHVQVVGRGQPPAAVLLDGPPADWEPYEGMLVTVVAPLTVGGTAGLPRFGEIVAGFGGRLQAPTEVALPGDPARAVARENAGRRILLDDGDAREVTGLPWYLPTGVDASRPMRAGSVIKGVTGVVDHRRGTFRLQMVEPVTDRVEQAPRPPAPTVAGDVRVAAFNVLNLFNGDGLGGGFPTERGAATFESYGLQRQKLVAAVQALSPDVAALMEIENDGYGPESALAQFVDALNAAGPITDFRFVDALEGPGTDAIRVAIVYRAGRVAPVGAAAVLHEGPFRTHSRAPLAQAFRRGEGPAFVVVANHFKSKSCGRGEEAATGADVDQRDGQSCWNALRVDSARRLDAWMKTDPTGTGADLAVLLGDFNAYAMEDPMRTLREAGWLDAFAVAGGARPYSYVFNGEIGRLDHALVSPSLADRLRGAAEWHSNSDELRVFDYQGGVDSSPFRASDHDPLVVGFDLGR